MSFIVNHFKNLKKRIRPKKDESGQADTWSGTVRKNRLLGDCPFVVFDSELSGLDPHKDFIVSIGAIKMTGETIHISREFYRLVRPAGQMSAKSVEIHGITPAELETKESLESVLTDFFGFIKDAVLVGHFVNIDMKFLHAAVKQAFGTKLANPAVDTHDVHEWLYANGPAFRKHYPGGPAKTDLFSVAGRYGISIDTAHDALGDAFITARLFQIFLHFLQKEGIRSLSDLFDIGRA